MFAWRADAFLGEVHRHLPDLGSRLDRIAADPDCLGAVFPTLPKISVDHGVMEKTDRVEAVIADFSWDDVGSFDALERILDPDRAGNRGRATLHAIDAKNLITMAPDGHIIAAIGLSDLVIIATEDVTLVCPLDRAQEVKDLVDRLSAEQKERFG